MVKPRTLNDEPRTARFLGGYAEGVTPVPIPNTEVKPLRADGTARVAVWESRSPPGINQKRPASNKMEAGRFYVYKGCYRMVELEPHISCLNSIDTSGDSNYCFHMLTQNRNGLVPSI